MQYKNEIFNLIILNIIFHSGLHSQFKFMFMYVYVSLHPILLLVTTVNSVLDKT